MQRGKKLGKNIGIMAIGTFGSRILTFFLVPLYTSCLTTAEYGIADLITTTISLLYPLFTVTIGEAVLRYSLDRDIDKKQVFTIGLLINVIGFAVLLLCTPIWFRIDFLHNNYIFFLFYYISYVMYQLFSFFSKGIDEIAIYTISGIFQTVTTILINVIALLILNLGIEGYLLSFVFSNSTAAFIIFIFAHLYRYISFEKIQKELLREMLIYSVPMIPNSISWWISNSSDKYILKIFSGATITGIYSVSYKIPTILSVFYSVFMSAWRLSSVEDFGSEESCRFHRDIFEKLFDVLALAAAGIILFNRFLAKILYAKDFYIARVYVPVLVIAVMVHGIGEYFGTLYTSAKKTKMLFYSSLMGAIANIVLNFLLIRKYSAMGAAIATLISYFIIVVFRAIHTRTIMKLPFNYFKISVMSIILIIMCMVQTLELRYSFIMSFFIFVIILFVSYKTVKEILFGINLMVINKFRR